jgi:hypothetical protein
MWCMSAVVSAHIVVLEQIAYRLRQVVWVIVYWACKIIVESPWVPTGPVLHLFAAA